MDGGAIFLGLCQGKGQGLRIFIKLTNSKVLYRDTFNVTDTLGMWRSFPVFICF